MARNRIRQKVWVAHDGRVKREKRVLARETPFEIQVRAGRERRTLTETLRTPGNDYELAAGLLFAAGYLDKKQDFSHMTYCMDDAARQEYNLLTVSLRADRLPQPPRPDQIVIDGRACGISSESVVEATQALWEQRQNAPLPAGPHVEPALFPSLADKMAGARAPGPGAAGSAAALFDATGELLELREDVDPANALAKLIGWGLLQGHLPFHNWLLFSSSQATFTTLRHAALAGLPLVCAPTSPSTLAVSLAHRFGITLVELTAEQVGVYTNRHRLK